MRCGLVSGGANPADAELESFRWTELALGLASTVLAVGVVALVPDLRHAASLALHGNLDALRHQILDLGVGGVALLFALVLAHAVLFYPAEIPTAAAGLVYGFAPGLALVMIFWLASALLTLLLGRTLGRPLLVAVFGHRRFAGLERAVHRGGTPLLVASRLIPVVPFSLIGYVAGALRISVWRFVWTTAVGFLPLTAGVAYLGSRAKSLSVDDPLVWIALGVILVLLTSTRVLRLGPSRLGADPGDASARS